MAIRINNLTLNIEEDNSSLTKKVAKKLGIGVKSLPEIRIIKESIDARKKDSIKLNYCIEVSMENEEQLVKSINDKDVKIEDEVYEEEFNLGTKKLNTRPVVIGMGPAGLFAALLLARKGYRPIVFERGEDIDNRSKTVDIFWADGTLKENSNVQFGEGGAGTFSDGKLTTRIKDARCSYVLKALVKGGAPEEIIYKAKPHVGTDILKEVVKNIREEIKALGGEVNFNSTLNNITMENGKIKEIQVDEMKISCETLILAIGHSSRDTYEMLNKCGIHMEQKPFAIGVRVEHPQELIDKNQYGKYAGHPKLHAAEYRLSHTSKETGRGVYSFCMCPGGLVVATASEEGRLVTNGMSYHARDKQNANSAIVVTVAPGDFESKSPLAGIEFQRKYEELAYKAGGGNFIAPVQLIGDFLKDTRSQKIGSVMPSYKPGYELTDMRKCLPEFVVNSLKEGLVAFDRKINGFAEENAIMTGIETRTSAPVRIPRNEDLQSISLEGLYPAGEGAGYAGGIISAAVDGLKVAEKLIKKYAPF
ncbi:NAD(P)/FAD-dependent oxidoreductase [Clostridium paridis]|uniref:FAD-dependent oxidoreductase n=1 Tax=Clostridium paridis TaxID=2803863 RepID=A0A937K6J2_9CLOT|nr:FAD-dependent oxidoreductase [Clostridium paridis]MBL4933855.1 FAD-dependent oxidoreductase [Clostridium paridis]